MALGRPGGPGRPEGVEALHRCLARREALTTRATAAFDASRAWEADGRVGPPPGWPGAAGWAGPRRAGGWASRRFWHQDPSPERRFPVPERAGPPPGLPRPCSSEAAGGGLRPGAGLLVPARRPRRVRVFDGPSRVLDVGVAQRLYAGATRRAVQVRDRACFHPYCDLPGERCQVDHVLPYSAGWPAGSTTGCATAAPSHRRRGRDDRPTDRRPKT